MVCVAGGTGLAPVKAIAEALTGPARPHPQSAVRPFFGARTRAAALLAAVAPAARLHADPLPSARRPL